MSYIVLDENDNKIYEGPEKRGHGYERRADGNFYKKTGDPRAIFEKHIEEIRRIEQAKFTKKAGIEDSDPIPIVRDSTPIKSTEYYAIEALPVDVIEKAIFAQSKRMSDDTIIFKLARFMHPIRHCEIIVSHYVYNKVIIDKFASTVSLWNFQNGTDTPDLVIKGLI